MRQATIVWAICLPAVFLGVFFWKFLTTSNKVGDSYLLENYRYSNETIAKMAAGNAMFYSLLLTGAYLFVMAVLFVMQKTK